MKDNMSLKDMGGRKSRKKRFVDGDTISKCHILEQICSEDPEIHAEIKEIKPKDKFRSAADDVLKGAEIDQETIQKYIELSAPKFEGERRGWSVEGPIAGYLLTQLTKRCEEDGKPAEVYIDAKEAQIPELFAGAKLDLLVLENARGMHTLRSATAKKLAIINGQGIHTNGASELLVMSRSTGRIENVPGTLIMQRSEADVKLYTHIDPDRNYHGLIMLDKCGDSVIQARESIRVKGIYCNGDLVVQDGSDFRGIQKIVVTGETKCIDDDWEKDEYTPQELIQVFGRERIPSIGYERVHRAHKMSLIKELHKDVSPERKIEIVKIMNEARYK